MNSADEIVKFVRRLSRRDRKRFAAHKSRAILRKGMSEDAAIMDAAQRLGIIVELQPSPHIPQASALRVLICGR